MPKRRKEEAEDEEPESTPRKSRRIAQQDSPSITATTPSNRKSILKGTPSRINQIIDAEPTPKSLRKVLFSTPTEKHKVDIEEDATPTAVRNDRSARRKSARTLQKQPEDDDSDDEVETNLAQEILESDDEAGSETDVIAVASEPQPDDTPSKRPRGRPRGRPKHERTPSPPPDLPPHELFFFQNRTGANKTSSNTLAPDALLNHDEYYKHIRAYKNPHEKDMQRLQALHRRAFDQWVFELEENFNLCLYGYGSKRGLVMEFVDYLYQSSTEPPKIVVVNAYTPVLTLRDVLTTLASVVLPKTTKLPLQPPALLDLLLSADPPAHPVTLIVHSLDHVNLRKHQATLARLAAHRSVNLIATVDTPHFGLLWDTTLLRQFSWLYHDATTFQPYTAELDVVEEVNALLGRSGRRLGGKDGVIFVLRSLTENARNLYRILVTEALQTMATSASQPNGTSGIDDDDADSILGASDEEAATQNTPSKRQRRGRPAKKAATLAKKVAPAHTVEGVEYRTLYHKAVEEFVCSSEVAFRTLLKEFHDHQMVESRRDAMGVERLIVPMARGELEALKEELA